MAITPKVFFILVLTNPTSNEETPYPDACPVCSYPHIRPGVDP